MYMRGNWLGCHAFIDAAVWQSSPSIGIYYCFVTPEYLVRANFDSERICIYSSTRGACCAHAAVCGVWWLVGHVCARFGAAA